MKISYSKLFVALLLIGILGGVLWLVHSKINATEERKQADTPDTFQRISQQKIFRVGYVVVPPWIIKDAFNGNISGSSVDLAREVARLAGWKIEFVEATWATFVAGLQTGQFDVSIVPAFVTVPRAQVMSFTKPVTYVGNTALVRSDSKAKTIYDLDKVGIVIAVTQGEQGHDFARTHFTKATIRPFASQDLNSVFLEVMSGRADAALGDTWYIGEFTKRNQKVRDISLGRPYSILPASWTTRPADSRLREFLDNALTYLEGNGTMESLDSKYKVPNAKPFTSSKTN